MSTKNDVVAEMPGEEDQDAKIDAILSGELEEVEEPEETSVEEPEEDDEEESSGVSIDDLPDDEELWPDGPLVKQIKQWKEEYGHENVYVTSITYDNHIVWRTINRAEYKAHIRNMERLMNSGQLGQADSGMYNEEAIAEMCMLFPEYNRKTAGNELAGVPAIIAQQVMEASGFTSIEVRQL